MQIRIIKILKNYYKYFILFIFIILLIISSIIYAEQNKPIEHKNIEEKVIKKETKVVKEESKIKVDIKGSVKKEGVYELNKDSRVIDVIKLAGGLKENANTSYINLSKIITDQMVIIIYSDKEIEEYKKEKVITKYIEIKKDCTCPDNFNDACIEENNDQVNEETSNEETNSEETSNEETSNEETTNTDPINNKISINTAKEEQLQTLTGIGESKAQAIIKYRLEKGLFTKIEDIKNVTGIGDSLFEKIKSNITV